MTDIEEILLVLTNCKSSHQKTHVYATFRRRRWTNPRWHAAIDVGIRGGLIVFPVGNDSEIDVTDLGDMIAEQARALGKPERLASVYAEWDAIYPWGADGRRL